MAYAQRPGAGFRRFDSSSARAATLSEEFRGLPESISPAAALGAMKRASAYISIPPSVVQLLDMLFSWTKPDDWRAGALPVVWPRNELLARRLGLQVRQVQNLLNRAVALGLISHRDSPNGHRGGRRGEDGKIAWGYGIVLAPIGSRYAEFRSIAERGAAEDAAVDQLKRRLTAARRRISGVVQTVFDFALAGTNAEEELALALMATHQMRKVRDPSLLTGCVEQIEGRAKALETSVASLLAQREAVEQVSVCSEIASSDEHECTHSTTTNDLQTAKAVTSRSFADNRSEIAEGIARSAQSGVEADLEKHGVDAAFIEAVTPQICHPLEFTSGGWGEMVALAERLANQNSIHRHAWEEACRLMGDRGAAASVIATVHKYRQGEVLRPGAYLRGMSERAARGELNLGRTFHGLRDNQASVQMQCLQSGAMPSSFGEIARRALGRSSRAFGHSEA
ncbi:plasmid replication protein RepC [Sphingomonas sp. PAMC 26605]|uniref:plasmid replication protein RepC n=1 Tax=Sphingomonas sp. PAMC 26605 TaxID=1112214 RepID=UPI00026CD81D|nr:plasmid replication protein RepC [Sphingomonas sp. PAMC 26605]